MATPVPPACRVSSCILGRGAAFKTKLLLSPIPIKVRITSVAAGENHCLALSEAGHVLSWGDHRSGQLGHGRPEPNRQAATIVGAGVPRRIGQRFAQRGSSWSYHPDMEDVEEMPRMGCIAAGADYSLAIDLEGNLYEWGRVRLLPSRTFSDLL